MNTNIFKTVILVAGILVFGVVLFRHDIAIAYHYRMMRWDWAKISKGENIYGIPFEHHRDTLTSLGYFERMDLPIQHVTVTNAGWKTLSHELTIANRDGWVSMRGYEPNTPPKVVVWSRPDQRDKIEAIVFKYDVP